MSHGRDMMGPDEDPEPWCTDEPVQEDIIFVMDTIDETDDEQ